jgi:hypothetical protein
MPGGRPTEYRAEYVEIVANMCANGATDIELADELDVSVQTLYNWRAKYPEFLEATRVCKDIADERVVRSLFNRAVGFEHAAVKIFMPAGATQAVYADYREVIPPDTAAAKFWLTNRKRADWQERVQQEHSGPDGGAIQIVSTIPRPPKDAE